MNEKIIIDKKYRGLPDYGNGGYVSGVVARFIKGTAEITLKRPTPLNKSLNIEKTSNGKILLLDGDVILAEGKPSSINLKVPDPPSYEEAIYASRLSKAIGNSFSSDCVICGFNRAEGDGLRIFPGPVKGRKIVAAPWIPYSSLADDTGKVKSEFIWGVLDCPGAYAIPIEQTQKTLLGRFVVRIDRDIYTNKKYITIGWSLSKEGRKHYTGTALFTESGDLCGVAQGTWIELK